MEWKTRRQLLRLGNASRQLAASCGWVGPAVFFFSFCITSFDDSHEPTAEGSRVVLAHLLLVGLTFERE